MCFLCFGEHQHSAGGKHAHFFPSHPNIRRAPVGDIARSPAAGGAALDAEFFWPQLSRGEKSDIVLPANHLFAQEAIRPEKFRVKGTGELDFDPQILP